MAQMHNVLLRGLNVIYQQAPHISKRTDVVDFLFLIHCYCDLVELHHKVEEEFLFPAISELAGDPDLLTSSVKQHETFSAGIHELHSYATTSTSPDAYSGPALQSLISSFAPALRVHLADEIDALLALRELDSAALMEIHRKAEKAKAPPKADEMFPLFLGLVDADYEGGIQKFPDMPFFMPWIVRYWFARSHWGSWRFLPCDFWGRRRELQFVG